MEHNSHAVDLLGDDIVGKVFGWSGTVILNVVVVVSLAAISTHQDSHLGLVGIVFHFGIEVL